MCAFFAACVCVRERQIQRRCSCQLDICIVRLTMSCFNWLTNKQHVGERANEESERTKCNAYVCEAWRGLFFSDYSPAMNVPINENNVTVVLALNFQNTFIVFILFWFFFFSIISYGNDFWNIPFIISYSISSFAPHCAIRRVENNLENCYCWLRRSFWNFLGASISMQSKHSTQFDVINFNWWIWNVPDYHFRYRWL